MAYSPPAYRILSAAKLLYANVKHIVPVSASTVVNASLATELDLSQKAEKLNAGLKISIADCLFGGCSLESLIGTRQGCNNPFVRIDSLGI